VPWREVIGFSELILDKLNITKMIESLKETMMPIKVPRRQYLEVSVDGGLPLVFGLLFLPATDAHRMPD
jgi:hypothetical protein